MERSKKLLLENKLPLNWPVYYAGLKKNFITSEQVIDLLLEGGFEYSENELLELINTQNDREDMLEKLRELSEGAFDSGLRIWQLSFLIEIQESNREIDEKLKNIEEIWSTFDYPESWRGFIYYLPTKKTNSPEDVYLNLIDFINKEKLELI